MTENLFLQDQAVSFHRPYPASLTALHEKQPEQGIFYRQDGTPFLKLWMKNACDVKIVIGQDTYILLEVERNLWEVKLPLEPGFYYAALYVDSVEIVSPYLPIGYGYSRPCNYLEIGPAMEACRLKDVLHGSIRHEYFYSEVTGQTESCLVYAPPGYDRDQLRLPVLYLQHGHGENEQCWVHQGRVNFIMDNLIAAGKAEPCIVVMNNGMVQKNENGVRVLDQTRIERLLLEDCIPFIESHYRVRTDKWSRAMAGLSMGSMQTSIVTMKHPDMFGYAGVFSGFVGPFNKTNAENSYIQLLDDREKFTQSFRVFFRACGDEDLVALERFEADRALFEEKGLAPAENSIHVEKMYPGEHEWNVWRMCLRDFAQYLFHE